MRQFCSIASYTLICMLLSARFAGECYATEVLLLKVSQPSECHLLEHDTALDSLVNMLDHTDSWKVFSGPEWRILFLQGNKVLRSYSVHKEFVPPGFTEVLKLMGKEHESLNMYRVSMKKALYQKLEGRVGFSGGRIVLYDEYRNFPKLLIPWQGIDSLLATSSDSLKRDLGHYPMGYIPAAALMRKHFVEVRYPTALRIRTLMQTVAKQDHLGDGVFRLRGDIEAIFPLEYECEMIVLNTLPGIECYQPEVLEVLYLHQSNNIDTIATPFEKENGFLKMVRFLQ